MTKFESDLSQTVRALHDAGVCHGVIKANNILVDPRILKGSKQIEREYIVIDLSAAILKHKVSERIWKRSQNHDLKCTRMIFEEIKAQKIRLNERNFLFSYCHIELVLNSSGSRFGI